MNIAPKLGIDNFTMSGGAVADDFDRDGIIDLMVGSWDLRDQLKFYKNFGNDRFVDRTAEAGLTGIPGGLNMVQADYNNDGHVDVLVLRGAWLLEKGGHPNSLLRNNGDGTFTDVTLGAGLAEVNYPTQTAAWADYDLDGDLDPYVGNEAETSEPPVSQLFRNNGEGTFTDIAVEAGVENLLFAKAVVWGDIDEDRYPDLFVSNLHGENRLYRNRGDGTFTDVANPAGLGGFPASFPAFFWDFDNDGNLDLYVGSYTTATHLLARKYLGPNKMYRNGGGQWFEDISYSGGFSHLQKGHAVVFADFDMDGDLDVFEQMGGAYLGDKYADAYYENRGFGSNWLAVDVVGRTSNRSAIGTKLTVHFREADKDRVLHRVVNSGGSFGANPLRQTIGLGTSTLVDRLEVFWPMTGETQSFVGISANQVIRVTEDRADVELFVRLTATQSRLPGRADH